MAGPLIWAGGHAKLLSRGTILGHHGRPMFPEYSFGIIQPDHGTSPCADGRHDALSFTSHDNSVLIQGDHDSKTVSFSVSKEFIAEVVKAVLNEQEKEKAA